MVVHTFLCGRRSAIPTLTGVPKSLSQDVDRMPECKVFLPHGRRYNVGMLCDQCKRWATDEVVRMEAEGDRSTRDFKLLKEALRYHDNEEQKLKDRRTRYNASRREKTRNASREASPQAVAQPMTLPPREDKKYLYVATDRVFSSRHTLPQVFLSRR